ncbi:hypothetical protein [Mucilaginibacter ginsenosidivorax]|uniref:Uncharacterized protein n=1 Tax=Mucilaginibacter ginsenosidivorax TaxID=862126 RepID=A0A5B8W795_9SPHI|nr:hypothetical protein [Mucilaginibacter ginsenosidivorax]QEC78762.1 hypothetical protein FSB76_23460 [Mucilaginibacter ginsenosidivorax]
MDITNYLSGITANITSETAPKSIPATVVGNAFTNLANLTKTAVEQKLDITGSTIFLTGVTNSQVTAAIGYIPGNVNATITTSKNLFNLNDSNVSLGHALLPGNTVPVVNANYNTTGFIPVVAGSAYTMTYKGNIQWYNSAFGFVAESLSTDTGKTQTAPTGSLYVRCNVLLANWNLFQFESGTASTVYTAWTAPVKILTGYQADSISAALATSLAVQPNSITPELTTFFDVSPNLFNPADPDVLLGYSLASGGASQVNAAFNLTGYIPVTANSTISVSYKNSMSYYTSGKVFISSSPQSDTNKQQVVPTGAAFVKCNVALASWATFQLEVGSSNTSYQPYGIKTIKSVNLPTTTAVTVTPTYNYTNGTAQLFLKEALTSEKQVFKIGINGDSILDSGHQIISFPDEFGLGKYQQGYGYLSYDGIERRMYNYLNFNKPIWANALLTTAWTYTGTVSNTVSAIMPNIEPMKLLADSTSGNTASVSITGYQTAVFVFEGGASGTTGQTGVVNITVSVNGGSFVNPSTILKGNLTKRGFGTTQIFDPAVDTFDTSFVQPNTIQADNTYSSEIELFYNGLSTGNTYTFKITRAAAALPVRLWGCYYFTGQTLIVHNRTKPGFNWVLLKNQFYSDFVLSNTDWVIMQSPMYHDPDLTTAETNMNAFIANVKSYGVKLCLTSCPGAGVATTGSAAAILGDTNSSFYVPGMQFYTYFNRLRKFNVNTIASGSTPVYGDVYNVTISGTTYPVTITAGATSTLINVNVLENFPQAPNFPFTLTKVSGNSGSTSAMTVTSQLGFYTMEQHRDLIRKVCYQQNLRFVDLLQAFADLTATLGESQSTSAYTMDSGHPLYASVLAASGNQSSYPGLSAPFQMNYLSNYFNLGDGHHLQYPAQIYIYNVLRMELLGNCAFKS